MNRFVLLLAGIVTSCLISLLFISDCSPEQVSGGGTEGGNTVCGVFINDDKSASVNTKVYLLPSDFNPGIDNLINGVLVATTDDCGYYTFDHAVKGNYSIQAVDSKSRKRTLITGIKVTGEDIVVPIDTLRDPGTMLIKLPETTENSAGYLYVPGTTIFTLFTDTSKFVFVNDVPAKQLPPLCIAKQSDRTPNVLRYDVEVTPNDTLLVKNTHWKYIRRLYLNTSASGANVSGNVNHFPLLIRLTRDNFDFSQALDNDKNLCFFRTDSVPLAYEIERWDEISGQAEIWVRVDSIYGNNNKQFITMYWGYSGTEYHLNDSAVFDTAAGFQGVWHLDGNTDTIYDATPNNFHGLRNGVMNSSPGSIGFGQHFGDTGAFIDMGNVLNAGNSNLTVSAWVKRSKTGLQTIMAKSDGGNPNTSYGWTLSFHTADQLHFFAASGGSSWGSNGAFDCWSKEEQPIVDTTTWYYVAAVFDRTAKRVCRLYVDGVEVTGGANGNNTAVTQLINNVPFRIGAEADGDYKWAGFIDECVVANTVRDEFWIRLCYSNQSQNGRLINY